MSACGLTAIWLTSLPSFAAELPAIDRAIAEAITSGRNGTALASTVLRGREGAVASGVRDGLSRREVVLAALDGIARSDAKGGDVDLAEANLLVGVLRSLDAIRQVEAGNGVENGIPAVTAAVWRRYVAPLVARGAERDLHPVAPRLTGTLIAQWLDGAATVRAFDLWADGRAKSLFWSRAEFAAPLPRAEALLERGLITTPRPPRPRLALYVDLAALRDGERSAVRRAAAASGDGRLLFVLDDSQERLDECLAAQASRRDAEAEEAAAHCRVRTRPEADRVLLFDPKRRLQVRSYDPADPALPVARMLAEAAGLARVWP
ncbi:hypothetical protein [Methylobacterium sp. Gmos1]